MSQGKMKILQSIRKSNGIKFVKLFLIRKVLTASVYLLFDLLSFGTRFNQESDINIFNHYIATLMFESNFARLCVSNSCGDNLSNIAKVYASVKIWFLISIREG
ncbi:CLUMA_CG003918, isoform A [Clunio marinus]|uniref:CLUMA_CG003918, isoform A n=1 Tax=Clunio marinus TaxID=568069 RepID=A0A1J1HS42_9DIPT|nr:CLUMA_CG003918, isoform A [Clunio marinus]